MAQLDLDPRIYQTQLTPKLLKYESLTLSQKHELIQATVKAAYLVELAILPTLRDPVKMVQKGFGLPLYVDAAIVLKTEKLSFVTANVHEANMKRLASFLQKMESLYNGTKPDFSISDGNVDPLDQSIGIGVGQMASWIMNVFYHFAWANRVRMKISNASLRGISFTQEEKEILKDSLNYLKTAEASKIINDALSFTNGNVDSRFTVRRKRSTINATWRLTDAGADYAPTVLGAMLMAMPPLTYPDLYDLRAEPTKHTVKVSELKRFFVSDSPYRFSVARVKQHIDVLIKEETQLLRMIDAEIAKKIRATAVEAAGQAAAEADLLNLEITPFYQKPLFTVGVAGAIFAIGYTILKR